MAEMSIMEYKDKTYYEITSSGLTHVFKNKPSEQNKYRRGQIFNELNYGSVSMKTKNDGRKQYFLKIINREGRILQQLEVFLDR